MGPLPDRTRVGATPRLSMRSSSMQIKRVDPQARHAFVRAKLPHRPAKKLDELRLWNCKSAEATAQAAPTVAAA
jgi:hypothetical protein